MCKPPVKEIYSCYKGKTLYVTYTFDINKEGKKVLIVNYHKHDSKEVIMN